MYFPAPLCVLSRKLEHIGVEQRLIEHRPSVLLSCCDDERGARTINVVEIAERMSQPRICVKVDYCGFSGGFGVTGSDAERRIFMKRKDVFDLVARGELVHQRQLGRSWIPKHIAHAFAHHKLEHRFSAGHVSHKSSLVANANRLIVSKSLSRV